jgi:hypothetical protein
MKIENISSLIIAFAHVLERINLAMINDWCLLEDCIVYWEDVWRTLHAWKYLNFFMKTKALSVTWPLKKLKDIQKSGYVNPDFMSYYLRINILEAVAMDVKDCMFDNAKVGMILAKYPPGKRTINEATGEGPTTLSKDGKSISLHMALPSQWAKLYTVWNLSFVTLFHDPYAFPKLLIPSVIDVEKIPEEYIFHRGFALLNTIQFFTMRRIDHIQHKKEEIVWPFDCIRSFWGKINLDCAHSYDENVQEAKATNEGSYKTQLPSSMDDE